MQFLITLLVFGGFIAGAFITLSIIKLFGNIRDLNAKVNRLVRIIERRLVK